MTCTHFKGLFVHGDLRLQTSKIEVIFYEFLRDLGKIFVA